MLCEYFPLKSNYSMYLNENLKRYVSEVNTVKYICP